MGADLSTDSSDADGSGPISAINVTPFVDVVLVLLVIFMVTAPVLMKESLNIHLPKASSAEQKLSLELGVAVTRQGQILINGELASAETAATLVKQTLAKNPDAHALISADAEARHGDVVRAIDWVKSAGMVHFAIQIEKP